MPVAHRRVALVTGSSRGPVTEVAWASHLAQMDFFVKSPLLLGRAVLPGMQARRYGRRRGRGA
jgi:hypothetical protein